jgi:SPX domain protein involved in polyphosphate accumulation
LWQALPNMKFGHTFETVAKSTWWEHERIDYKLLKKVLKAHDGAPHHEGNFMAAVLREIQKVARARGSRRVHHLCD